MKRSLIVVLCLLGCLTAPAVARAELLVGAAEDGAKQPELSVAMAKMQLARLAGFNAIRVTAPWTPGMKSVQGYEKLVLENAAIAANLTGVRLFVAVYPKGSKSTPLTEKARSEFAGYAASLARALPSVRDFVVGNEPNLNRFWMPQFGWGGGNAAATAYLRLLVRTYAALKDVSSEITVVGGALASRGGDNPRLARHTHSPTKFILDLGDAYRRNNLTRPVMDAFALHPYPESSRTPPSTQHPNSTTIALNDYAKLRVLLGIAFDGTAQPGSELPVLYAEFGVQTRVTGEKTGVYKNGASAAAQDAVTEDVQALHYRQALELVQCQADVLGLLFFHVSDEEDLAAWQSGVYYADDTPKSSLTAIREASEAARAGKLAACPTEARR